MGNIVNINFENGALDLIYKKHCQFWLPFNRCSGRKGAPESATARLHEIIRYGGLCHEIKIQFSLLQLYYMKLLDMGDCAF